MLQWNVLYKEDINNIVSFLKDNPTDVVCLQELTIDFEDQNFIHTPNFVADALGYHHYAKEIPFSGKQIKLANAIFSRFPITRKSYSWVNRSQGTDNYDDENRAYVEVDIDINGEKLAIGTVHLSYVKGFVETARRLAEADKLFEAIERHDKRFVLTGDLNALPASSIISGLESHLVNAGPDLTQNTWTTKPFEYQGFSATELNWRLDYIFHTSDVSVISADIVSTDFSDHLPIKAVFELNADV